MSIIRSLKRRPEQRSVGLPTPFWSLLSSGYTIAGNIENALTYSAVWACIDVITDAVSRTPVDVVRYRGGARQSVEPRPKLIASPNPTLVAEDVWRTQLAFSMATQGNGFGVVLSEDGAGYPTAVQLVDPYMVSQEVRDGLKWLTVGGVGGRTWEDGGRYWHLPGRHVRAGSPYALSPCEYAGETIGLGLAARKFSNQFFTDGGHPVRGFISDEPMTEDQAKELKAKIVNTMKGREPLVHGSGLKSEQYSVQPGETQFIDLMRFVNEEAARVWRVPPSAISAAMSGQSVTYASIGEQDIQLLKNTLDGYYVRIETGLTACLPQPQKVKFNRNAILRADVKTRNEIYDMRLKNKTTTVNAVRALEDEEPFPDPMYDEPGIPGGALLPALDAPAQQGTP